MADGGNNNSSLVNETDISPWTRVPPVQRCFDVHASLVLIGMPGAGKRSLGFIAATHLKRRFRHEDRVFEAATGLTRPAYLQRHGREALMSRSLEVLRAMLDDNSAHSVIACSANTLTPDAAQILAAYAQTHPVVHVTRDIADIQSHCHLSPAEAQALLRADAGHRACSNFEFFNVSENSSSSVEPGAELSDGPASLRSSTLHRARLLFCSFVDTILHRPPRFAPDPFYNFRAHFASKHRSFVTEWQLSSLADGSTVVSQDLAGVDVVELRIDTWDEKLLDAISKYVAEIRSYHKLSIVYTVDDRAAQLTPARYWSTVAHGLRLGADGVVINGHAPVDMQQWLLSSKGYVTTFCHYNLSGQQESPAWRHSHRRSCYVSARQRGYDVIRLIQLAASRLDNAEVDHFREQVEWTELNSPILIVYNTGRLGRSSRIRNTVLTPVSPGPHTGPNRADLTIKDVTRALFATFEYDPLQFYVFSSPSRAFSRSPAMYNSAFEMYGLSHEMCYQSIPTLDELMEWTRTETFGGAAISFPFKEALFGACVMTSRHAEAIGSVNSIMPLRMVSQRKEYDLSKQAAQRNQQGVSFGLYGENTDWFGFYNTLRRYQSPRNAVLSSRETALVLGAGGSARAAVYALLCLGYQNIYIRNRTETKAVQLAQHFNDWCNRNDVTCNNIVTLDHATVQWPRDASLPTVVIACVPTERDFHLPDDWLDSPTGGVVAEIAYKQASSLFLDQVRRKRAVRGQSWCVVDGFDILFESAVVQFEFFTGYRAPRAQMADFLRKPSSTSLQ